MSDDIIVVNECCSSNNAAAIFEQCSSSTSDKGAPAATGSNVQQQQQVMSKNQRKKRERLERYVAQRQQRRRAHRERQKERKRADKMCGRQPMTVDKPKLYTMNESKCRIRVAVDMAYDELMDERTVKKTVSQLGYCYAANRRAPNPLQFYVVNLDGKGQKVFDEIAGYQQWDVHFVHQPLTKLWDKGEIVYLTADSENTLNELDETKVYVIGGLLDHNHHKGLCLRRANANGFAHAKLPIGDFVRMSTRKVLAINHVFEILLHFTRQNDWERAFLTVIPKRKLPPTESVAVELEEMDDGTETLFAGHCENTLAADIAINQRGTDDDGTLDGDQMPARLEAMDETDRLEMSRMIEQIDDREEGEGDDIQQQSHQPPPPVA